MVAFTTHGHQIPGTIAEEPRPTRVARCGGVHHCKQCIKEVELATAMLGKPAPDVDPNVNLDTWEPQSTPAEIIPMESEFEKELGHLLNRHSAENESGTPDFILAMFLAAQLDLFNQTIRNRAVWRGEHTELPALYKSQHGIRTVPMVMYTDGQPNEIGTADIQVTPGETAVQHPIKSVSPTFELERDLEEPKDDIQPEAPSPGPESRFERYQKRGLSQ